MKKAEIKMSLFWDETKGITNTIPFSEISLSKLVETYQSNWLKVRTERVVNESDEKKQKDLKSKLPYITPYGCFLPERNNDNLTYYNSNLIAFDVDKLDKQDAFNLRDQLATKQGCLISIISPRRKGVKAFFLISEDIPSKQHDKAIKDNLVQLCKLLDISEYLDKIDQSQFRLSQALFLNHDPDGFFNLDAIPLEIKLQYQPQKEFIKVDAEVKNQIKDLDLLKKTRIKIYLLGKVVAICKNFMLLEEGQRHSAISEVMKVKCNLHYLPEITDEVKNIFKNTIEQMYNTQKEKNEGIKYFEYCWDVSKSDLQNEKIDEIIKDLVR